MIDENSPEARAIQRELDRVAKQAPTRAEKSRQKRIEHWLRVKREAEGKLKELGYEQDED